MKSFVSPSHQPDKKDISPSIGCTNGLEKPLNGSVGKSIYRKKENYSKLIIVCLVAFLIMSVIVYSVFFQIPSRNNEEPISSYELNETWATGGAVHIYDNTIQITLDTALLAKGEYANNVYIWVFFENQSSYFVPSIWGDADILFTCVLHEKTQIANAFTSSYNLDSGTSGTVQIDKDIIISYNRLELGLKEDIQIKEVHTALQNKDNTQIEYVTLFDDITPLGDPIVFHDDIGENKEIDLTKASIYTQDIVSYVSMNLSKSFLFIPNTIYRIVDQPALEVEQTISGSAVKPHEKPDYVPKTIEEPYYGISIKSQGEERASTIFNHKEYEGDANSLSIEENSIIFTIDSYKLYGCDELILYSSMGGYDEIEIIPREQIPTKGEGASGKCLYIVGNPSTLTDSETGYYGMLDAIFDVSIIQANTFSNTSSDLANYSLITLSYAGGSVLSNSNIDIILDSGTSTILLGVHSRADEFNLGTSSGGSQKASNINITTTTSDHWITADWDEGTNITVYSTENDIYYIESYSTTQELGVINVSGVPKCVLGISENQKYIWFGMRYGDLVNGTEAGQSLVNSSSEYASRNITSYQLFYEVVLDGVINSTEWYDAEYYATNNLLVNMTVWVKCAEQNTYFAVMIHDSTLNDSDFCELYFDVNSDSVSDIIDTDDIKFNCTGGNVTTSYNGTGDTWNVDTSFVWDANASSTDGNRSFEFKINRTLIWGANPTANSTVPFGIHYYSNENYHIWYSDGYNTVDQLNDETPNTWGLMGYTQEYNPSVIPMFRYIWMPSLLAVVVFVGMKKKRGVNE